jgi:UDP-glucose 4-epimerase
VLGWRAEHDVDAMCRDAWRWQSMNPDGYRTITRRESATRGRRPRIAAARAVDAV